MMCCVFDVILERLVGEGFGVTSAADHDPWLGYVMPPLIVDSGSSVAAWQRQLTAGGASVVEALVVASLPPPDVPDDMGYVSCRVDGVNDSAEDAFTCRWVPLLVRHKHTRGGSAHTNRLVT